MATNRVGKNRKAANIANALVVDDHKQEILT